jgi:hypothetical protein
MPLCLRISRVQAVCARYDNEHCQFPGHKMPIVLT